MENKRRRMVRLVILGALVAAFTVVALATDLRQRFSLDGLRALTVASGPWGVAIYLAIFCAGLLLYVPGMVFLAVAILAWGRGAGSGIAFGGALLAVSFSFVLVRVAGGQPLGESTRPFLRRALASLDKRPVLTVFLLRLLFWTSPPLNYALALSSLRFRSHLVGSALGLVVPVGIVAVFTETVVRLLS